MAPTPSMGWKPQPDSPDDWIFDGTGTSLKPSVDLRNAKPLNFHETDGVTKQSKDEHAFDQGDMDSCVANGVAAALIYCNSIETQPEFDKNWCPSRLHIWFYEHVMNATKHDVLTPDAISKFETWLQKPNPEQDTTTTLPITRAKAANGGPNIQCSTILADVKQNEGGNIRDAFRCLVAYGVCTEFFWPYLNNNSMPPATYVPPTGSDNDAKDFSAKAEVSLSYWRIKDAGESNCGDVIFNIKAALSQGYPVVFGFWGSDSSAPLSAISGLDQNHVYQDTIKDATSKTDVWGHCVVCIGYGPSKTDPSKTWFTILNSWGEGFGDQGCFYMPESFFDPNQKPFVDINDDGSKCQRVRTDDIWVVKNKV